jgi:hypothetical protein
VKDTSIRCVILQWRIREIWQRNGIFCRDLIGSAVQLQNKVDELIWTGGDKSGTLSVKNVYCALAKKTLAAVDWWLEEEYVVLGNCIKN